jgi:SAM-dependent methyltransferase
MSSAESPAKPHSAEYFGEQRDFWWNADFVALMARRWRLDGVKKALDLGCGVGHWGRVLLPHLPPEARLFGVDREPRWVTEAAERAARAGFAERTSYRLGDAGRIPFHDGVFDLVTCQTLLIHVPDPRAVLREMIRVLEPGGLVAVVEPNNLANGLALGTALFHADASVLLDVVRFQVLLQLGKARLGEGHNAVGEQLPGYLAELGLTDIQVYVSDKASPLYPPYAGREQQVLREEALSWADRGFLGWDRDEIQRYLRAAEVSDAEHDRLCAVVLAASRAAAAGLRAGTEHVAGGGVQFLISGRKPA